MNELIREIEDDIRRERFDKLWHGFGKLMVTLSVAVILVTVVFVSVQSHRRSVAMERTSQFIKGLDRINIEDYKGAIVAFDALTEDTSSPYYGPALLRKAQAQKALGDKDGAAKTYAELASRDGAFGDLAKILASGDKPVEPVKGSPFYYTQAEWKGWQLMSEGKKDEAVGQFLSLYEDQDAPYTIHERMGEVIQHLAPEKIQ